MLKKWNTRIFTTLSLLAFLFSATFCLYHLKDLKILVSMTELVDSNLPSSKNYQKLKSEFNLRNSLYYIVSPKNGENWKGQDSKKLEAWSKRLVLEEFVESVTSPFSFYKARFEEPSYIHYYKITKGANSAEQFESNLKSFNDSPWRNIMSSSKGDELSLEVAIEDAEEPQKFGAFNPKAIKNLLNFSYKDLSDFFDVKITGSAIFTYYAFEGVQHNFIINSLLLAGIFLVFRLLFGTFKSGLFLIFSFIWVGVLIHGIMAFLSIPMEILSSGLFIMIAVASVEDYFFILHEDLKGVSLKETFKTLRLPSFFTSFTTVIGFGSLYFTDLEIVGRFGLMAAVGAILEWIAIFYFLPVFLRIFKIRTLVDSKKSRFVDSPVWSKIISKLTPNRFLGYLSFIFYPLSLFILLNLQVSDSPLSLFPKNHQINKDFKTLKESRGWEGEASLVFPSEVSQAEQKSLLQKVKEIENVDHIESYFEVEEYLVKGIPQAYQKAVTNELELSDLHERYFSSEESSRHILYFKDTKFSLFQYSKKQIEEICDKKCDIVGEIISYAEFMDKIPLGFIKSLGFSLLFVSIIILCLAIYFKFPSPLPFVLSSLWGPSILLILMWTFQIKINFLSCVFVTMMVGITGDNAIQFLFAHSKQDVEVSGIAYHEKCALQMGLLLSVMCLLFLLSYFAPPREFGLLMSFGFLCSLFGDICLAKGVMKKEIKV